MRKTRLVILPTKCLHQMGFLLLFLSCPVIGDWGRIRPESENSHNAIQIDREGTCGFERDPPGGLMDFLIENGSQQCRPSEVLDSENKAVDQTRKSAERQDGARRGSHERTVRTSGWRKINERDVQKAIQKRMSSERRDVRKVHQRDIRSRSVESRRSNNRNNVRVRSLSLSRTENQGASRSIRQNDELLRRDSERLLLTRRMNEEQNKQRMQPRRATRKSLNERRENERIQVVSERRERENVRLLKSAERGRTNIRREIKRRSIQEQPMRRESEMPRRQNEHERMERRLSMVRREQNTVRLGKLERRRSIDQVNLESRIPEIRKTRNLELDRINSARKGKNFGNRKETDSRRFVSFPSKVFDRNVRERVDSMSNKIEGSKLRRLNVSTTVRNQHRIPEANLSIKKADENLFNRITKWADLKPNENYKTGDWTINCVIGAVVYYFTTKQIKTA